MMPEISLNILDIAENSTRAGASLVTIEVAVDTAADTMTVVIADDGCGMTEEQVASVTDPFFTTRTTRKVGLGVPFLKQAAEMTGGSFLIESEPGVGTTVTAVFGYSNIDRQPLGDMDGTILTLIECHTEVDFRYIYRYNEKSFELDTREMREILGGVPLNTQDVMGFIRQYLKENRADTDGGAVY
jgi:hypothetical protein